MIMFKRQLNLLSAPCPAPAEAINPCQFPPRSSNQRRQLWGLVSCDALGGCDGPAPKECFFSLFLNQQFEKRDFKLHSKEEM